MTNKIVVLLEEHEEITAEGMKLLKKGDYELFFPKNKLELFANDEALSSKAMLVRGAIIGEDIIERMPNLKIIARGGVGIDNIDIEAATQRKIHVCNVPDANFTSVAEHVVGMLLSLSHQIVNGDRAIRKGEFHARHKYIGRELTGKTIGIIGFGRIGQLVAEKCVYGLNMNVLAYDPFVNETKMKEVELVESIQDIFKEADFITLHLPYIPTLHHFINSSVLKNMKPNAYIINCARGGLIDEEALAEAVKRGDIAGAGIDVFQREPIEKDHVLLSVENIIATPHMGASTFESLNRMVVGAVKEIIRTLEGNIPENSVNTF